MKPPPPQVQGPGVVRPELTPLGDPQGGVRRQGVSDGRQGGDDPAGEDVLLNPAEASPGGEDPVVSHGDCLDAHLPSGRQKAVERGEVGSPVGFADRLDADDCVVLAFDLTVVLQAHVHAVGYASCGGPLAGEFQLLSGQGDRGDLGSSLRCADGEGAPSGADFQQPGAAAYAGEVENPVD